MARYKRKRKMGIYDAEDGKEKGVTGGVYRLTVLLPNGASVGLRLPDDPKVREMCLADFICLVKKTYLTSPGSSGQPYGINWESPGLFLQDAEDTEFRRRVVLSDFGTRKCHFLRLHDGSPLIRDTYENMWEILLNELPIDYTFEAALADLIDNSLQAVWGSRRRRKFIRLMVLI